MDHVRISDIPLFEFLKEILGSQEVLRNVELIPAAGFVANCLFRGFPPIKS